MQKERKGQREEGGVSERETNRFNIQHIAAPVADLMPSCSVTLLGVRLVTITMIYRQHNTVALV